MERGMRRELREDYPNVGVGESVGGGVDMDQLKACLEREKDLGVGPAGLLMSQMKK